MRILVVEDDQDLLRGLVQAFREEAYAVDSASDGESGLQQSLVFDYDLVVLDVMLPGINGLELMRELRKRKQTPVLLLTARDTVADRVHGLDEGADDYLIKPFDLAELLARARSIVRRANGVADPLVRVGEVVVDTAAKTVAKQGQSIELTAREYALLEMLVLRRGRLVSRSYIYDHLFDDNHNSMSNLVDVYISRLRSKLGKTMILTRRGEGYIVP